jgi:hypothetical protein
MRMPRTACVLLLLFAVGCRDGFSSITFSVAVEPQDLPQGVAESARQHWPGARIQSAERVYDVGTWEGDYMLNLEIPGGMVETATFSKAGVVEWRSQPFSRDR